MWSCVCALCLHPAIPGLGVRVCVFVCTLGPNPANPDWVARHVCSGAGFCFTLPILAGVRGAVFGCICLRARSAYTLQILARPCGVGVLWFGFWLYPAISCWGVGVCVFVCAPRLYPANPGWGLWRLCLGPGFGSHPVNPGWGVGVCVFVCALRLYPAIPGWGAWCVCSLPLRLCCGWAVGCVCRFVGSDLRGSRALIGVVRALRIGRTQRLWLPGTWSCANNVARGVPLWRAL